MVLDRSTNPHELKNEETDISLNNYPPAFRAAQTYWLVNLKSEVTITIGFCIVPLTFTVNHPRKWDTVRPSVPLPTVSFCSHCYGSFTRRPNPGQPVYLCLSLHFLLTLLPWNCQQNVLNNFRAKARAPIKSRTESDRETHRCEMPFVVHSLLHRLYPIMTK